MERTIWGRERRYGVEEVLRNTGRVYPNNERKRYTRCLLGEEIDVLYL
jgi:hypothetical protein